MGFDEAALAQVLDSLPQPSGWLVAFSGGLDSSVLLHAMARLHGRPLRAVHIHHGLLPHADGWSEHCRRSCERLGVALETMRLDLTVPSGESPEAFAREARYDAIAALLRRDEMLLTAQHRDDQAETLLLQALRGAGIEGLAGMPLCRRWRGGWHARPLLAFSRAELHAWASAQALDWVDDPSNRDRRFDRNFLRHEVMPLLAARWPAADRTLARSAAHLADSLEVLHEVAQADLQRCRRAGDLLLEPLRGLSAPRRAMVLRAWVRGQGYPVPDRRRMQQIDEQALRAEPAGSPRIDWGGVSLRRYRELLCLTPNPLPAAPREPIVWAETKPLQLPPGCGELRLAEAENGLPRRFWSEGRVSVRWPEEGLRCRRHGRAGSRSLKKLCQEWGVPPWERPYLPLVYVDERLAAVAGFGLCEGATQQDGPGLRPVWTGLSA
jgi:tRNA(Ile)-lysidine synthase